MMKAKKIIALMMGSTVLCGSVFSAVGCGREQYDETIDTTKTTLIVSNYEGGFGSEWLEEDIKPKFEALFANESFEKGKVGVQVVIDGNKTEGDNFDWSLTDASVAFNEKMTTTYLASMVAKGQLMPLNDVMTDILSQENVSLAADKMEILKVFDGSTIYQIPHYEGGGGIVYDKDVFNEYSLYLNKKGSWTNADGDLSVGADGVEGTLDDGLPATYKEFFKMCERMRQNEITPFIISGEWKTSYYTFLMNKAALAYNGIADTKAYLYLDGTEASYVSDIQDSDGYFGYDIVETTEAITPDNAYNFKQTAGRLYALEMLKKFIEEDWFDVGGWAQTTSHLDAQDIYLKSSSKNEPIAMLIDGTWWENEATPVFDYMGSKNANYKKSNRNFGWMPLPTKVDENDTNTSVDSMATLDHLNACVIVEAGLSEGLARAAKEFVKFCYTEENLEAFTIRTGTTRVFSYKLSDEAYNQLTPYQKDVWKMHEAGMFVPENSSSQFYLKNKAKVFSSVWQSEEYLNPLTKFDDNSNKISAKTFFTSYKLTKDAWDQLITK